MHNTNTHDYILTELREVHYPIQKQFPIGKWLPVLLIVHVLLRSIVAATTDLGIDEVYYTSYVFYPDFSYFDHPPMVAWLIWGTTFGLKGISVEFLVRLGPILLGTFNLWLVYKIAQTFSDAMVATAATVLAMGSFYASIIVGVFIMPDTAQSTFWLLALLAIVQLLRHNNSYNLLWFGLWVGLACWAKYHAVFLWLGLGIYILCYERSLFRQWQLYVGAMISLVLITPIIYWNLTSEFCGMAYHSNRIGNEGWSISTDFIFSEIGGQIFYNNPISFSLIIIALIFLAKNKGLANRQVRYLFCSSLPLITVVLIMALFNRTLPHWTGPSYYGLFIIAAYVLVHKYRETDISVLSRWLLWSNIFMLFVLILALLQINGQWLIPAKTDRIERVGKNDPTVDLAFWTAAGEILEDELAAEVQDQQKILAPHWFPAAHLDYYFAKPNGLEVYVWGPGFKQHHYLYAHTLKPKIRLGDDLLYITHSLYYKPPKQALLDKFENVSERYVMPIEQNGNLGMHMFVWKLRDLKTEIELTNNY